MDDGALTEVLKTMALKNTDDEALTYESHHLLDQARQQIMATAFPECDPQKKVVAILARSPDGSKKELTAVVQDDAGSAPQVIVGSCQITYEDINPSDCVEYCFPEAPDKWAMSQLSLDALETYRGMKFEAWKNMLLTPTCEAQFRRMLHIGMVSEVYDPYVFPTPESMKSTYQVTDERTGKLIELPHPVSALRVWQTPPPPLLPLPARRAAGRWAAGCGAGLGGTMVKWLFGFGTCCRRPVLGTDFDQGEEAMSFAGTGKGAYRKSTTYKYVGEGAGEFDMVSGASAPRVSDAKPVLIVCCGAGLGMLLASALLLGLWASGDGSLLGDFGVRGNLLAGPSLRAKTRAYDAYDCEDGFSHWRNAWPEDKVKWCCSTPGRGCPTTMNRPWMMTATLPRSPAPAAAAEPAVNGQVPAPAPPAQRKSERSGPSTTPGFLLHTLPSTTAQSEVTKAQARDSGHLERRAGSSTAPPRFIPATA